MQTTIDFVDENEKHLARTFSGQTPRRGEHVLLPDGREMIVNQLIWVPGVGGENMALKVVLVWDEDYLNEPG